jgi:hypothetical protein
MLPLLTLVCLLAQPPATQPYKDDAVTSAALGRTMKYFLREGSERSGEQYRALYLLHAARSARGFGRFVDEPLDPAALDANQDRRRGIAPVDVERGAHPRVEERTRGCELALSAVRTPDRSAGHDIFSRIIGFGEALDASLQRIEEAAHRVSILG